MDLYMIKVEDSLTPRPSHRRYMVQNVFNTVELVHLPIAMH